MPLRTRLLLACAAAFAAGCVAQPVPAPSVPPVEAEGLVVTLAWSAPVDLDLYVTMPGGETVYYANPGRAFANDTRCDTPGGPPRSETARWRSPAPGRYRVGVDFPEACGGHLSEAPYRVVVDYDGRRTEHEGVARIVVRNPAVLDVDVAPSREGR